MKVARDKRFRVPAAPPKPGFSPMAAPVRRLSPLVSCEELGWRRELESPDVETYVLTARYGNGATRSISQSIMYAPGERERIVSAVVDNLVRKNGPDVLGSVARRRAMVKQNVYRVAHSLPFIAADETHDVQAGA